MTTRIRLATWLVVAALCFAWSVFAPKATASDHHDGPRVLGDPKLDITDLFAFPSPSRPGYLVLIMNTVPLADTSTWFSENLTYNFIVRPARIAAAGSPARVAIDGPEFRLSCSFQPPFRAQSPCLRSNRSVARHFDQRGLCLGPGGRCVPVRVNAESGTQSRGLRVFAGVRSDPFFLNVGAIAHGNVGPTSGGENSLYNKNVLGIVLELDAQGLFGKYAESLLAVVTEVSSASKPPVRFDRQGRSEMTNITLSLKQFDQVNRDLEIRDLYNQENTFSLSRDYLGAYRARYNANLGFWDQADGKTDWPLVEGQHPLTELLLTDVLLVDPSKPNTGDNFFEIEKAALAGQPYTTCGGRMPNEDTVDSLLTLFVNGGKGRIGDGVDKATRPATNVFPYLAGPTNSGRREVK